MRDRDEILRRRAEHLAARADTVGGPEGDARTGLDVVVVHVGPERWALASSTVREVVAWPILTPLPGLPPGLRGLCSVRGDLVGVVDPRPAPGAGGDPLLVVIEHPRGPVGLLVDGVAGFERLPAGAPVAIGEGASAALLQVTGDGVQLMDACRVVEALAAAGVA